MAQQSCSYCSGPFNCGNCPSCRNVGAENEFIHDPNTFPYNNTPDFYDQPPQHHVETYSRELCGNDSHYGYDPSQPDLEDFFIMGNKELSTILEKESDEIIKSSVEDFVPIPSESKDTFVSDSECNLPSCDDFSPINVPEGKSMTFSNHLFDSNDDFTSSDDESLSDEDVLEDNVKIYSNPLFEFDDEYISIDINPFFDEVLEDIESKASYDSNLDDPALLVTPLFDSNKDECFDPGGDVDKINAFDIPSDFEDSYYDSKGDVLYLESFHSVDTTPNLPPEVFLYRDPRSLSDINDLKIMVKNFDPGIPEKIFSPTY
nr:hypothetical protein [Tanacetum cinerariifolium]